LGYFTKDVLCDSDEIADKTGLNIFYWIDQVESVVRNVDFQRKNVKLFSEAVSLQDSIKPCP
jgi:hypothetical protein